MHDIVLDPAGASLALFLVFVFPKKRCRTETIELACLAERFGEGEVQGRDSYFAGFGKSPEQASLALRMLSHLRNRDYVDQYAGGKRMDNRYPGRVIECYRDAMKCGDTKAHCVTVESRHALFVDASRTPAVVYGQLMDELAAQTPPQRYLFPCAFLRQQRFQLDVDHPSDPIAQIRGAAVHQGCDWCSLFDPNQFKQI